MDKLGWEKNREREKRPATEARTWERIVAEASVDNEPVFLF